MIKKKQTNMADVDAISAVNSEGKREFAKRQYSYNTGA